MASFSIISRNFWSKRLVLIRLGSCVTAPPFTAGEQVHFTVSVMGRHTVTLIRKGAFVFGGYTDIAWGENIL